ncbi:unnamed protein product [Blepharisma stoltei]|uniref:Uncharacterized protein n=1 Tax=Blepharisma stoltei TaxID=1481888 RepID=A0AAU9IM18_9CILI|nr:unnamed protein product [Blepharisma stoltei]
MYTASSKTPKPLPPQFNFIQHRKSSSVESNTDEESLSDEPPLLKTKSEANKYAHSFLPPISTGELRKSPTLQIEIPPHSAKVRIKPLFGSPANENEKVTKSKITLIDDFGLLNQEELDSDSQTSLLYRNKAAHVTISDFWGKKTTQTVLHSPNLKDAVRYMKHKRFVDDITIKSSIAASATPRQMDEHVTLRLMSSTSKGILTPTLTPFSAKTPSFVIKSNHDLKRSKELRTLNKIMKGCDELHMDNMKAIQSLSIDRRKSYPTHRKLTAEDKKRIKYNKKLLS